MHEKNEVITFIVNELRSYKRYKAMLETVINESVGIQACTISDMPHSITNKFSSITENNALYNKDVEALQRDIKRVDIWLEYLLEPERFVIDKIYIQANNYHNVIEQWYKLHNIIYSSRYWKYKRKMAINKIYQLFVR